MKSLISTLTTFILFVTVSIPSFAVTPKEFLEDSKDGERGRYIFGALEAAMGIYKLQGNPEKSACIKEWFAGNAEEAHQELINAIHQVKDKDFPVAAVILILINRHCGDVGATNAQSQPQPE